MVVTYYLPATAAMCVVTGDRGDYEWDKQTKGVDQRILRLGQEFPGQVFGSVEQG